MASAEDTGFKIEKLSGDNFHSWKFQMKMYLIGKDLWDIITGDETLNAQASAQEQRKFRKRENMALATVCLSVTTSLQIYVRSANTAKEAWDNLQKHFERKSLSQKIFYHRKLYSARMKKDMKMIDHVNYVKTLAEHLEAVDDNISEKDLVIILISSLPDECNYLITALETMKRSRVHERLLKIEECLGGVTASTNAELRNKFAAADTASKLPKLMLKKFSGEVIQWQSFWDSYKSAMHNEKGLSVITKFSYLRDLLEDSATSVIAGLPTTEANYSSAIELLQRRFGDK